MYHCRRILLRYDEYPPPLFTAFYTQIKDMLSHVLSLHNSTDTSAHFRLFAMSVHISTGVATNSSLSRRNTIWIVYHIQIQVFLGLSVSNYRIVCGNLATWVSLQTSRHGAKTNTPSKSLSLHMPTKSDLCMCKQAVFRLSHNAFEMTCCLSPGKARFEVASLSWSIRASIMCCADSSYR